ncbi:MAG: flagellar filament capping protein FliD [Sphingomonadaceae bacterium]|nr:flagellar filament capping protein FliD [Sphingomonadaceae bacterium]
MESSSLVTQLGAGSGINMAELATNLATAQFDLRNQRLAQRSDTLERQISTASELKNMLSQLASALGDRVRNGDLSAQPSLANSFVANASVPPGTSGSGTYSLEVSALASAQTLASPAFANAGDTVGAGQLVLRFGATSGTSFTADAGRDPVAIDIASGSSLTDIAAAINAKGAGVEAYVAQTTSGAQLVLKGQEGAANGFILEATETVGEEGLAALAWDPSTPNLLNPSASDPARLKAQSGDAAFELDGLSMTSSSNDTGEIAPGLSLELKATNIGAPTTISFSDPADSISEAMQDLVTALNEVAGQLKAATDPLTGDLSRDSGARALRRDFSGLAGEIIMPNAPETGVRSLSDLGLATERDGTFRLDGERLQATLARDPDGAAAMFTSGLYGVYATVDRISRAASSTGDPGSLAGSLARYERLARETSEDTTELAEKQEALRAQLLTRFSRADIRIGAAQATLSFLQQQIDAWNGSRG